MSLPNDPIILLSYINTQLRDHYKSLDDLCKTLNVSKEQILYKLKQIDYAYDQSINQFI